MERERKKGGGGGDGGQYRDHEKQNPSSDTTRQIDDSCEPYREPLTINKCVKASNLPHDLAQQEEMSDQTTSTM